MKIGILGGTFDPVHTGHLIVAEEILEELQLDKVIFIPAGEPWMKADRKITPAADRITMVRLAIASNPRFELSTVEVEHPGWTYTVDTLEQLRKGVEKGTKLFFLAGWDSLNTMPKWKEPNRIATMATIVTFPRPGVEEPDMRSLEKSMPGLSKTMIRLESPVIGISSTDIRKRLATGKSVRYLLPAEVSRYIAEKELYKVQ